MGNVYFSVGRIFQNIMIQQYWYCYTEFKRVLYHNRNGTTTLYDTHVVKLGSSEIFYELRV